jgi:hypothetical protein
MEGILNSLRDPVWWFTVVIAATIVSVFSYYIVVLLNNILSALSTKYKNWRKEKNEKNQKEITSIAGDPTLLIITFLKALFDYLVTTFFCLLGLLLPITIRTVDSLTEELTSKNFIIPAFITIMIMGYITGYLGGRRMWFFFRSL